MRPSIRVPAAVVATLGIAGFVAGCSGSQEAPKAAPASSSASKVEKPAKAPAKAHEAPIVAVGKTATYTAEDSATNAKTKMSITLKDVKTVTPSEIGTTTKPKGQYVALTLTVKNVGSAEGGFHPYGLMKWEDSSTAEQDASTLETSDAGQDVDTTYKPGQSVTGDVVLDVPRMGGRVNFYDSPGAASLTFELPAD